MISRVYILSITVILCIIVLFISSYIHIFNEKVISDNKFLTMSGIILMVLSVYFITPLRKMIEA